MSINFKQGIRRIIYCIIIFGLLFVLSGYFTSGCIFDHHKFLNNIQVIDSNNQSISLPEFVGRYVFPEDAKGLNFKRVSGISCFPDQGLCTYTHFKFSNLREFTSETVEYKNNTIVEINTKENKKIKMKIVMPSKFDYLKWQIQDFFMIFIFAGLGLCAYFILEFTICWIIKGFKE